MHIKINGINLYFDAGVQNLNDLDRNKETIILIPGGLGLNHAVFKPAFDKLRDHFNIIYVDLRGTGESDIGNSSDWTKDNFASDIEQLIEALGLDSAHLYAHSAGVAIALEVAKKYPSRVSSLILSNACILPRESSIKQFAAKGGDLAEELARKFWLEEDWSIIEPYLQTVFPLYETTTRSAEHETTIKTNPEVFIATKDWVMNDNVVGAIKQLEIHLPIILFLGKHDPFGNLSELEAVLAPHALISKTEVFEDSGHDHLLSEPNKTLTEVQRFISQIEC